MSHPNRLTIYINGMRYAITASEDPDYVRVLAQEIDNMVRDLMNHGTASMNEALVLTALSAFDSARRAEASADNLRGQVTGYVEDAAKARLEVEELKREIERLKHQAGGQAVRK